MESTLTPLVAEGLALIALLEAKKIERDEKACELRALDAELTAVNDALIALGAGRYRDEADHTALVIAAIEPKLTPDTFRLPDAESVTQARALAGDDFMKLFHREIFFRPREGFDGIATAVLTPAKARDLISLCIVPGVLAGGRKAYVRWK